MPEERLKNTKSLEDKAWGDMLNRLNATLPVSKGMNSRELALLLLLLLMMVCMGSYIAFLRAKMDKTIPQKPAIENEYFAHSQKTDGINQDIKTKLKPNKTTANQGLPSISKLRINYASKGEASEQKIKSDHKHSSTENLMIDELPLPDQILAGTFRTTMATKINQPRRNHFNGDILENKNHLLQYTNESLAGPEKSEFIFKLKRAVCRHTFALNAGMITENMFSFGGIESGISYQYAFNRNWALQSGLDFQMFFKNGFSNVPGLYTVTNPFESSGSSNRSVNWVERRYSYDVNNAEIINNEVGVEYIAGIVDHLYYASIPVNIVYSTDRNKIFAGINYSLLLRGTNMVRDYSDQYFNTVILSNKVLEKRNYLNRLDFGIQLGFETRLYKNVSMYAKYNYGMLQIINSESGKLNNTSFKDNFETIYNKPHDQRIDFNRYISIGLKYSFGGCN